MNWSTQVRHIMSTDPISVVVKAAPSHLRDILDEHSFHHIPVLDDGRLVGVVSTVDLAKVSLGPWVQDADTEAAWLDRQFTVSKVMTWEPEFVRVDDTARRAAEILAEGGFHSLPVLDGDDKLVGMLTSTDLLRWLVSH